MAKSSIHFEKSTKGGLEHNDRTEKIEAPHLLPMEYRKENEYSCSAVEAEEKIQALYSTAKDNHKENFGQRLQAKTYSWEAVVNLNEHHKMQDVDKMVLELEKETGFKCVQKSIHRDEGRVNERGVAIYNYHVHVTFFTLDQTTGQQLYRKSLTPKQKKDYPDLKPMNRNRLSKLQTITANSLGMKRGIVGSKAVRYGHKQYKDMKQNEESQAVQSLAKQRDLNKIISRLRAELKENGAIRADYAKLEQVNKDLKLQVKAKDLTIGALEAKVYSSIPNPKGGFFPYKAVNEAWKPKIEELKKEVEAKNKEKEKLKATKEEQDITILAEKEINQELKSTNKEQGEDIGRLKQSKATLSTDLVEKDAKIADLKADIFLQEAQNQI